MKNHYFSTQNHEKSSFFIEKSWIFMTGPLEWGVRILGFARISRTGYAIFFCSGGVREKIFFAYPVREKKSRVPPQLGGSIFNFFQKLGLRDSAYPVRLFRNVEYVMSLFRLTVAWLRARVTVGGISRICKITTATCKVC